MTNDKFPMTNKNSGLRVKPAMTIFIEYGLYLLIFLLPIQTRLIIKMGATEYSTYSLYGTDILLILVLLMFIFYKFSIFTRQASTSNKQFSNNFQLFNFQTKYKVQNLLIFGLIIISAVSIFGSFDKALALFKFGWLILGVGLFWLVISANYNRLKLIYAILSGMFFQAVLGIWQFLSQSSFANKWLGLALHRGASVGTSVIEAVGADGIGERWLRAYGGLDHPNMLGGMLAIGALLLIGEMIKSNKIPNPCLAGRQANNQLPIKSQIPASPAGRPITNYQNIIKFINWTFLLAFTAALFFSFSRSAWLGLAVGMIIILVMAGRNLKLQKNLAEIILIMGILLFVLFSQYQNLVTSRISGEGRLENKSTSERLVSYKESWQMIKNNWLFGVGLGNYTIALNQQVPKQNIFYYQPTHSVYLLVLSEIGILGFAFFVGLLIVIARSLVIKATRQSQVGLRVREIASLPSVARNDNAAAVLAALVVLFSFDHWLWSLHFGVLFFWLVLGLVTSSETEEKPLLD